MKLLLLFVFTYFVSVQAHAGFTKTIHDFGNFVPRHEYMDASFEITNREDTPVIIIAGDSSNFFNHCKILAYTIEPIRKNYKGRVNVRCRFTDVGFNYKQVALMHIHQGKKLTHQPLNVKAMVVDSSECGEMDLNREDPLKKMPILDQDGMGICYAFSSSQMLEYQARRNGINRTFSPIDASFLTKIHDKAETFQLDAGQPDRAIRAMLKEGVATRECIDGVIKKYTTGTSLSSEEFLALVEKVWKARRTKSSEQKIKADLKKTCDLYGISVKQFSDLLGDLDKPFKTFLYEMFDECDRRPAKQMNKLDLDLKVKVTGSDFEMVKFLDRFLDKKSIPAVAICAEILQGQPKHRGLEATTKRDVKRDKNNNKLCGMHSVLITARRKVNHRCEYLVRNSWGATWAPQSMTCACKTPTAYYPDCSLNKEKSGNKVMVGCWIKEESLLPNTKNIIGFK